MKGLRHLTTPTATVSLADGQSFSVSGLSPNHIFGLYHRHRADLSGVFDAIVAGGTEQLGNATDFINGMFGKMPLILAEVITLAAGGNPFDETPIDPDDQHSPSAWQGELAAAASLPIAVQADALSKIGDLTFTSEMPPKKFLGVLVAMINQGVSISMPSTED